MLKEIGAELDSPWFLIDVCAHDERVGFDGGNAEKRKEDVIRRCRKGSRSDHATVSQPTAPICPLENHAKPFCESHKTVN